ncbi:unnamed protein product [Agarophyton chilense]|eukprot:gb/GEZJ01001305.1/.p2 GENE.gb/GEZJ01001305.1/~~gb/GEZJ01001305.1/.p2  ORF type:complete len:333 (-),score=42.22 gb/GEZJ01001305.1/:2596-3594(-)
MVLINIRAPIVTLIVAVICLVVELSFLIASLWIFQFITCRRLTNQQSITVRSQKRAISGLAVLATLMFVVLETIISVSSQAVVQTIDSLQECIQNKAVGIETSDFEIEGEIIHYGCTTINGNSVTHHPGNYSLDTGNLQCAADVLYSYTIGERQSVSWADGDSKCDFVSCLVVVLRGDMLYISVSVGAHETEAPIEAIPTNVTFLNINGEDLKRILNITMNSYVTGIQEETDIRRRALAAPVKSKCEFTQTGTQSTSIPLSVIVISSTVWILSILFFLASFAFKNKVFFDSGNPTHWASLTWHDIEASEGDEPRLMISDPNGSRRIRITGYL